MPSLWSVGDEVRFRDWTPAGELVILDGVVNGTPFGYGPPKGPLATIVPVYVSKGDRIIYVNSMNILEES